MYSSKGRGEERKEERFRIKGPLGTAAAQCVVGARRLGEREEAATHMNDERENHRGGATPCNEHHTVTNKTKINFLSRWPPLMESILIHKIFV